MFGTDQRWMTTIKHGAWFPYAKCLRMIIEHLVSNLSCRMHYNKLNKMKAIVSTKKQNEKQTNFYCNFICNCVSKTCAVEMLQSFKCFDLHGNSTQFPSRKSIYHTISEAYYLLLCIGWLVPLAASVAFGILNWLSLFDNNNYYIKTLWAYCSWSMTNKIFIINWAIICYKRSNGMMSRI